MQDISELPFKRNKIIIIFYKSQWLNSSVDLTSPFGNALQQVFRLGVSFTKIFISAQKSLSLTHSEIFTLLVVVMSMD